MMSSRPFDPLFVLEHAQEPLRCALRLLEAIDGPERLVFAAEALQHFGGRCSADTAREIVQYIEQLATESPEGARHLLALLPTSGNAATSWVRAALLACAGDDFEAAATIAAVGDSGCEELRAFRLLTQSRYLLKSQAWQDAWLCLREAISLTDSYQLLTAADNLVRRLRDRDCLPYRQSCKLALLGSTNLEFFVPALHARCVAAGIAADIYVAPFGEYQQAVLDPGSALARFSPEVVAFAIDWRAPGLSDETDDPALAVTTYVSGLRQLWRECKDRWGAFVIQHNLEIPVLDAYGRLSAARREGKGRILRQINLELWEAAQRNPGVVILDVDQLAGEFGKQRWGDPVLWHAARQYPSPSALPLLARHYVALLRAVYGMSAKCLVLDLDNTLWGGVIGEDGLSGIELGGTPRGEAFLEFQKYILSLRRRGVILAACSKNDELEAKRPFLEHPDMVLSLDDFTVFVASWRPKDQSLHTIASALNIALESLVFVDDDPVERSWVRRTVPDVIVPEMPSDPAYYAAVLARGAYFETLSLTDEDRRRGDAYRENVKRSDLQRSVGDLDTFLRELSMEVELAPFDEPNLPRVVQLLNKTNQFNLTTRRLTDTRVRHLLGDKGCYTQMMRVRDRFGDNGVVGVLIAFVEGQNLRIDNWLMSCRVLGRRLEEVMLDAAFRYAVEHRLPYVVGEYVPTAKNARVNDLFDRLGFELYEERAFGRRVYRAPATIGAHALPPLAKFLDYTTRGVHPVESESSVSPEQAR